MKIIRNVTANLQQTGTKRYGDEIHVYLNETEVIDAETGAVTYSYDKVIVADCLQYADPVKAAIKYISQKYLDETDYINNKYREEVELFELITKEEFLSKYDDVYTKRAECRKVL